MVEIYNVPIRLPNTDIWYYAAVVTSQDIGYDNILEELKRLNPELEFKNTLRYNVTMPVLDSLEGAVEYLQRGIEDATF